MSGVDAPAELRDVRGAGLVHRGAGPVRRGASLAATKTADKRRKTSGVRKDK